MENFPHRVSTTHQNIEDCLCPCLGNSSSILSFLEGSWPIRRVSTSAVEFGSKMPESLKKKSSRGMRLDLNITTVRHFLHWPHRTRRTSSMSTVANENERPGLEGAFRVIRGC